MTEQHGLGRLRFWLGAYLFVLFAYFGPGATWSPVSRFCLTRAIVEKGTFEITEFAASTGDRAKVGERYYSDKAPLPSLLAVPAYAAFHAVSRLRGRLPAFEAEGTPERPAVKVTVSPAFRNGLWVASASTAALSATALGLTLLEVLRRRFALRTALAATLGTLLGTPLFPYATSFFGHTIAAALLFGGFALLDAPEARHAHRVGAGVLLGAAVGTEYVSAIPALLIFAYSIWRAPREKRVPVAASLAGGAALPLAVVGFYQQACFGAPWRTAYSFIARPSFAEGHAKGLLGVTFPSAESLIGITFGRARGVFYIAPITALALFALAFEGWKSKNSERLLALTCVVVSLWINASYYMWSGGWATGPRHAVPGFAFLAFGIALVFDWKGWPRTFAIGVAGISVLVMVLTTAVGLEAPPDRDAIFGYLLPNLSEGRIARLSGASNLGMALGLPRRASVIPLLLFCAFGAFFLLERAAPERAGKSLSNA